MPATANLRLLVVGDPNDMPLSVGELIASHAVEALFAENCRQACEPALLTTADAVVLCPSLIENPSEGTRQSLQLLADALVSNRLTSVSLSPQLASILTDNDDAAMAFMNVSPEASADELWGRVSTIQQYRPLLQRMEAQVVGMQRLGKKLNQQFVEVDQELRLASRLQRDFLPKHLPEVGDIRFGVIYRPATWVSGDVYDIQRLDESHLGLYLADAVGHGVAAGLLTMFIKQAIISKQIQPTGYRIVPPQDVLERLNGQLADQQLPNCQFVTACYATIDTQTREVTMARGGHPHPLHIGAEGTCAEVRTIGGLLGIFSGEEFPSTSLVLEPGDKFVLYSDGLEDLIICRREREQGRVAFTPEFMEAARLPVSDFIRAIEAQLDGSEGSLQPADDVTLVAVERLASTT